MLLKGWEIGEDNASGLLLLARKYQDTDCLTNAGGELFIAWLLW